MKRTLTMFLTLVALALFLAAGCGGNKTKDGDAKTKDGNGKTQDGQEAQPAAKKAPAKLSEKLIGTWEGAFTIADENAVKAKIKEGMGTDTEPAADADVQKQMDQIKAAKMTMTFNGDGTVSMKMEGLTEEPMEESAKWAVVKETDKELTLKSIAEGKPEEEVTFIFDGDDRFTTESPIPLPGIEFVFDRKK